MAIDRQHAYQYYLAHKDSMQFDRLVRRYLSGQGLPQSLADELRSVLLDAASAPPPAPVPPATLQVGESPPPPNPPPVEEAPKPPPQATPPERAPEPAMSSALSVASVVVPVLVAGARTQIEDLIDQVVPALLSRRGASEKCTRLVLEEFEDALRKTARVCGRGQADKAGAVKEIALTSLAATLEENGILEQGAQREITSVLAAALDAATDTGALEDVDQGVFKAGLDWLSDFASDILEADPKKLEARAARAENRARMLRERAAEILAARG